MKKIVLTLLVLFVASGSAFAGKISTRSTEPSTCSVGDIWINPNGAAYNRIYTCTATDTWTLNYGSTGGTAATTTADTTNFNGNLSSADDTVQKALDTLDEMTGGTGAVDSVNGATGVVVLDADDIDDTSTTNKFVTASDLTNLGNLSGTNTGDQDLSGYLAKTNTTEFTPTGDYNPATKKYVDDNVAAGGMLESGSYTPTGTWDWTNATITWPTFLAANISVADTGGYWTGTTVEAILAEIGAEDTFAVDATYFTLTSADGTSTIGLQSNVLQPYDADMISWPSAVDATEVGYLDGVTSSIQAQIDAIEGTPSFTTTGLTAGTVYYMASGGSWTAADADGTGTYPARCIAISTTQCISQGQYTSTSHGLTIGSSLWLSETAGEYTTTQPSTSGSHVQSLGWVLDANTLVIDVDSNYATVE